MSEIFQIIKWDELVPNHHYTIKNIQDDSTFTGEFIMSNLDFIEGFENETESRKYLDFDEHPFNDEIEEWQKYVDEWLIFQNLDASNPRITEPLYNLFGEVEATPNDIADTIYQVFAGDNGDAFFEFLNDPQFIIDADHIDDNISYNYDIIGVLFKNVNENNEIIDYKWFQIIRYEFSKLFNINPIITRTNKKAAPSIFLETTKRLIFKKPTFYAAPLKIRQGGKAKTKQNKKNQNKKTKQNKTKKQKKQKKQKK